jgi:hypothetical protein
LRRGRETERQRRDVKGNLDGYREADHLGVGCTETSVIMMSKVEEQRHSRSEYDDGILDEIEQPKTGTSAGA